MQINIVFNVIHIKTKLRTLTVNQMVLTAFLFNRDGFLLYLHEHRMFFFFLIGV